MKKRANADGGDGDAVALGGAGAGAGASSGRPASTHAAPSHRMRVVHLVPSQYIWSWASPCTGYHPADVGPTDPLTDGGQTATGAASSPAVLASAAAMADRRVAMRARTPPTRPRKKPARAQPHSGMPQGSRPVLDRNTRARDTHTAIPTTVLTQSVGFVSEIVVADTGEA